MPTPSPNFDLTGRVALVTGASRGIGRAIAETYARAGARVVLASRTQETLDAVADDIRAGGGEALAVAAHAGDPDAVAHAVAAAVETFGGVDILVNNAATNPHFGPLLTASEGQWDKILDVNVKGYARFIAACAPAMRERGGGAVVNVASVAGLEAFPNLGVYGVSKAAVLMLTRVLAVELASDGIRVNALAPGIIRTKFSRALLEPAEREAALLERIPQRRIGAPQDVSGLALYLASDAAAFTTGGVFVVDGGQHAGRGV